MDLKIPNIVKPIALKDYAEEFGEVVLWVWVNPTRELRTILVKDVIQGNATDEQIGALFSELWSQGPQDTHFSPDEVMKFANTCMEQDPQLWQWVIVSTINLLFDHLGTKKKSSITPPSN
jgi:hypothetical protein